MTDGAVGADGADVSGNPLLSGPLRRTVLLLAWPVLCEQVLGFLVGLYDTWLSGRIEGISEVATGAVGLAAYVGWLASMLFGLVATGTTALVARHRGAGEPVEAGGAADKTELTRTSLEAHQTLIDANPENVVRFKEVTRFLEEDLKQQEAADSAD